MANFSGAHVKHCQCHVSLFKDKISVTFWVWKIQSVQTEHNASVPRYFFTRVETSTGDNRMNRKSSLQAMNHNALTFKASMATLQPSGLPPYVEPCSPGLICNIMSSSHSTADTCRTKLVIIENSGKPGNGNNGKRSLTLLENSGKPGNGNNGKRSLTLLRCTLLG